MEDGTTYSDVYELAKQLRDAETRQEKEDILSKAQSPEIQLTTKQKENKFKIAHGFLIGFLCLIVLLHILGIYLFTSGFLLTRLVLEHKSDCAIPPIDTYGSHQPGSSTNGCWHPKTFDKAVVIIIDALRYDFTVPFQPRFDDPVPHHFHNALPYLYELAASQPRNAFLRPFIADPPTTTLQRLKGLTTGTLPTFIDAGSNFAGTAIDEDNLIAQMLNAGKNVVHLGDDTWHALFPDYFDPELTKPFDSFNVWDLHTVDNGVSRHLMPLLQPSNSSKWDVIIGHYLGVDHAGHRYGPDHSAMAAKLQQMDEVLREVVQLIDDGTLLVVMGDHGMDSKGDHGGESSDEVEAALWMYSKAGLFGRSSNAAAKPPQTAKERPVGQIDLVPTLALLLGLPIPFNNLGAPIEEAFIGTKGDDYENLARVNRLTGAQVHQYQEEYALVRKPDPSATFVPLTLWDAATRAWVDKKPAHNHLTKAQWENLSGAFLSYQQHTLAMCKDLWARFDLISMSQGIVVLLILLGLVGLSARALTGDTTDLNPPLSLWAAIGISIGASVGLGLGYIFPIFGMVRTSVFLAAFIGSIGIAWNFWAIWGSIASLLPNSVWGLVCAIFPLLLSIGFASNSFTIWEDEILLFFLAAFGTLMLSACFRLRNHKDRIHGCYHAFIFMVMIRLASLSRLCREEQMPYCRSTFYASATSSTSAPWQLAIPYLIAIILPTTVKVYFERTASYNGSAPFWIGIAFRLTLLLIAVYWTIDAADDGGWLNITSSTLKTARMYIAQLVLAIAVGAGSATFAFQAPFIGVDTTMIPTPPSQAEPSLRNPPKSNGAAHAPSMSPQLTVHGTGNLYGSHFATLPLTILLLPLLLFQKPMGQATLALTTTAILSLFELLYLLQRPTSFSPPSSPTDAATEPYGTSPLGPTILALLGHFAFFKTGHQAALASIQWDAAFIPLRTIRYPWTPIFVVLNTFAGQILCAVAVPAVVLWRRPYVFSTGSATGGGEGDEQATVLSPSGSGEAVADSNTVGSSTSTPNGVASTKPPTAKSGTQHTLQRDAARRHLLSDLAIAALTHVLVYATINVATTVWAAHLRRHLMLYRVFSPRWMLGVLSLVIVELVLAIIGVGAVRWSVGSVGGLFGW